LRWYRLPVARIAALGGQDDCPPPLTLMWFQRNSLPVDWATQRALVTAFEAEP